MRVKLLEVLCCTRCEGNLSCEPMQSDGEVVQSGTLRCAECDARYPIHRGIPRFVPAENYAASFGYQWNRFRVEQLDSRNGTRLSAQRFYAETRWSPDWLRGKWVLDAGCGAGRFLDVIAPTGAEIVGIDVSNAVDAARDNLAGHDRVHLVQASIYDMPFRDSAFDAVYCIGVAQHAPKPLELIRSLPRVLRPSGPIALTIYEKRRLTRLHAKYVVRPVTRRLGQRTLLGVIRAGMPALFPVTSVLFRIPMLGRAFRFVIPVANYVAERQLTARQRYAWAIMDTYDMLAPRYDAPQTEADVRQVLGDAGIVDVQRTDAPGLNLLGKRVSSASRASLVGR